MPRKADNSAPFVFLDPQGRRWPRLRRVAVLLTVLVLAALVLFVQALLVKPELRVPASVRQLKGRLKALQMKGQPPPSKEVEWKNFAASAQQGRPGAAARPHDSAHARAPHMPSEVRLGYYAEWDPNSFASLEKHADELTHVCPEWLSLVDGEGTIKAEPDVRFGEIATRHQLVIMPLLNNMDGDDWVPEAVENIANGPRERRSRFIGDLLTRLRGVKAGGVVIDWEQMDPACRDNLTTLLRELARSLHDEQRELWLTVPLGEDMKALDLDALAPDVDHFIAVLHDETADTDPPGPIASQSWLDGWLGVLTQHASENQWIAELGVYGYDWKEGGQKAATISFADAMARADNANVEKAVVQAPSYNAEYAYQDPDGDHQVCFLDAVTFANQLRSVRNSHFAGVAVSRLGLEDPGIWKVLRFHDLNAITDANLKELRAMPASDTIANISDGEIVTVDDTSSSGSRTVAPDQTGHLVATYTDYPGFPTIFHEGAGDPHEVCLTFDDGPNPEWTPEILDILRDKGVKATFFIVGRQAEDNPDLIRRILSEGHEIGNHTYTHANLSAISQQQIRIELNATQRLVESLTGRTITLFRPPYNADSRPADIDELRPLKLVQDDLGYLIVLENIDPEDWSKPGADVILDRIKEQRGNGSIILLHDAGGNRAQTVEALPRIIDWLRERGDRIVSVGELLNIKRDEVMPPTPKNDAPMPRAVTAVGFLAWHSIEQGIWAFMIFATVLILLRTLVVVVLAALHRRRKPASPPVTAPLSVLIAAYNEERVIEKTVRSVLDTGYPGEIEVIVADDGSTDGTATLVAKLAADEPRLHLIRQANAGKAHALRAALAASRHEILVFLDADTVFERATLGRLVAPFADENIGAVSGHAKVGNLRSFIARCQALEYTCGFNLDRRAYTVWDCITVVPGAISALRKEAVLDAGGFSSDTLAEDTDLTLTLHRKGWTVDYAPDAVAYTEAPETMRGLAKQRFRWAFGTIQCLWKHRDLCFNPRHKALGWFSLPGIWFFQILLVALTPLIDLLLLLSLLAGGGASLWVYFIAFLLTDLLLALLACHFDGEPLRKAFYILPMRIVYRPLLSWVVWKSLLKALKGAWVTWGKLDRTASVPSRA